MKIPLIWLVGSFILSASFASSKPEFLPPAMNFGAKDCSFCHATATGGEALNNRGERLLQIKERTGAENVDVEWLRMLERAQRRRAPTPVEGNPNLTRYQTAEEAETLAKLPLRKVDYTTAQGEWPGYSGNLGAQKYSSLQQITLDNVDELEVAWIWTSNLDPGPRSVDGDTKGPDNFKGTPLMVNNKLFIRTRFSGIVAIDPLSGATIWEYEPDTVKGPSPPMFGFTTRGLSFHQDKESARVIYTSSDGYLIALDADTGEPITEFGENGVVDLKRGLRRNLTARQAAWSNVPSVCDNVIIVGSQTSDGSHWQNARRRVSWKENLPVGDVRGFDVKTGEQLWTFHTVPQKGEFGTDTWEADSWQWVGNVNVWSQTSCDTQLGHVYLPLTAPTHHLYGGDRPGNNLFSTSTVALDIKTGKRVWHYQIVHHDIWDYDLPAPPVVTNFRLNGKPIKAVAQPTKMGYLFVFDRVTGKPVWPITERKAPPSDLPGEVVSPTQPHPTKPPPFVDQGLTQDELIDFTPELKAAALKFLSQYKTGPQYLPASIQGSIINPGVGGGANWGGGAVDPVNGDLFIAGRQDPMVIQASPNRNQTGNLPRYRVSFRFIRVNDLPITKPPWSTITAYNLSTGSIKWQVPNGAGPKHREPLSELDLPDLGNPSAAPGLLVTPELIFYPSRIAFRSTLAAIDKATGEKVWEVPVTGGTADAPPMTYSLNQEQYVVVGTGLAWEPARLIAFRLKR